MASDDEDHTATVYGEEDLDEEDDESEEEDRIIHTQTLDEDDVDLIDDEDDDEEEDDSMSSAAGEVTIAVAGIPNVTTTVAAATPTTATTTTTTASIVRSDTIAELKKPPLDDSRRLFQRLWTDEDEIELLQGFLDYMIQRGTNNSSHHHHDTAAFYDQIKGKLQLDFNKNQLVEKLRRLKKKYRNVLTKISSGKEYVFKSPHDQATFDLSCKIWNEPVTTTVPVMADVGGIDDEEPNNANFTFNLNDHNGNGIVDPTSSEKKMPKPRKRSRVAAVKVEENYNHHHHQQQQQQYVQGIGAGASSSNPVNPNLVEETVKSCLLPLFKELVNNSPNGAIGNSRGSGFGLGLGLGGMNVNSFGGSVNFPMGDMSDEKWRKQQILELEVYSKRLDLMQDQIKSWLEELRSMGN